MEGQPAARQGSETCNTVKRLASAAAMGNIRRLILGVEWKRLAGPTPRLHDTRDGEAIADNPPRGKSQDVRCRKKPERFFHGMKHAGLSGGILSDELQPGVGMGSSAGLRGAPTGGMESLNDLQPMSWMFQVEPCSLEETF